MPIVSRFFGIIISMYYNDHQPPHFHIRYGEYRAQMAIETLAIIEGELPRRVVNLTMEWAALHRDELRVDWELARNGQPLERIVPLD